MSIPCTSPKSQRGAVLFVALVFMVLITLLGLTAAASSVLQERMTGGLRNSQLSLMGAETTVRGVEWMIWNRSNIGNNKLQCGATGGSDTCYSVSNVTGSSLVSTKVGAFRAQQGWPSSTSGDGATTLSTSLTSLTGNQVSATLAQQPRYIIEDLGVVLPPGSSTSGGGGGRLPINSGGSQNQTLSAFRITSRSTGGNQGSVASVESYFVALPPSF